MLGGVPKVAWFGVESQIDYEVSSLCQIQLLALHKAG
jgi:hypothetical protein